MPNRRAFLKSAGGAAGGLLLTSRGLTTRAQSVRREIMLNGRRITTVDVHAHCVFPEVEDVVAGTALDRVQFPSAQMLGQRAWRR